MSFYLNVPQVILTLVNLCIDLYTCLNSGGTASCSWNSLLVCLDKRDLHYIVIKQKTREFLGMYVVI